MTIVGVHGFCYDPKSKDNNPDELFAGWAHMLDQPIIGFGWYSSPLGIEGEARALAAGYLDQYAYAYKALAPLATAQLAAKLIALSAPVSLICHSLGSVPALKCLEVLPEGTVDSILILDGAIIQKDVPIDTRGASILNICSSQDLVLRDLGAVFNDNAVCPCIGQAGLGYTAAHWRDIFLDNAVTQEIAHQKRGWDLRGTMPGPELTGNPITDLRNRGDHWTSYEWEGNWPLYQAWFKGEDLSDII